MNKEKKKIAVLGSGMSALAAVYELTSYEGWEDAYDITIYQMGWRLGGKTATGRGPNQRIQEHGIHIAQGWYNNAFRLIQDAYKTCEVNNLTPDSPFQTWEQAFDKENTTLLTQFDKTNRKWISRNITFPGDNLIPGQGGPPPLSDIIYKVIYLILEMLTGSTSNKKGLLHFLTNTEAILEGNGDQPHWWQKVFDSLADKHKDKPSQSIQARLLYEAAALIQKHSLRDKQQEGDNEPFIHQVISKLVDEFHKLLKKLFLKLASSNEEVYWLTVLAEFGIVNIKGVLEDVYDPATHKLDFTRIDHLDYREWLKKHGGSELMLDSAIVRFLYVGTFHNLTGLDQQGSLAAGVAVNFLTLSMGYKGAFVWKFKGGTADTMITPVYEVLKFRGVKFEFFNKVEQVHYSPSGNIKQISMGQQVTLKNGTYDPVYKLKGLSVWPDEPLYDQINDEQARSLKAQHIDLEMAWSSWKNVASRTLEKGEDFDYVILGIPIDALQGEAGICREIIENEEKWQQMVANVKTTATMAMQLWLKPTLSDLGMDLKEWGFPNGSLPNLVTYASPMYSWIDMSQVLPYEDWGDKVPGLLAYYTGSMTDPQVIPAFDNYDFPAEQLERVIRISEQWLRDNIGWFFANATTPEYPQGMRFDIIADPSGKATTDYARLKTQFFRANFNPTDRYTLSLPGSNKYRLKTNESGFDNLLLTGDWTDFGVNVGYYEGAIVSGLKAGQALRDKLGMKSTNPVFGEIDV